MASKQLVCLCTLAAFPALAPAQITSTYTISMPRVGGAVAAPYFDLRADPPTPKATVEAGFLTAGTNMNQAYSVVHRYFYDKAAQTYFGYDVVIRPEPQPDTYRVTLSDLAIGPLDFVNSTSDPPDPAAWKKLPIPPLPAPRVMRATDTLETVVSVHPVTHQKLVDSLSLVTMTQIMQSTPQVLPQMQSQMQQLQRATQLLMTRQQFSFGITRNGMAEPPAPPTVSGEARAFAASDAEMRIQFARITLDGTQHSVTTRGVSGSLLWLFVPDHGRYILSLSPRPELGFVRAGELRGGVAKFEIGADKVLVESTTMIAPGDAPYFLYVLHDPEWAPTAQEQGSKPLMGSVSAGEISALMRK